MKLEPDLIKKILEYCEDKLPDKQSLCSSEDMIIPNYDSKQIQFHTKLLMNEGYLVGSIQPSDNDYECLVSYLSMNGYQYLNLLRSKAWNTAKSLIHETGVIFAEAAIKAVIDKFIIN